jgi:hypothetical protein
MNLQKLKKEIRIACQDSKPIDQQKLKTEIRIACLRTDAYLLMRTAQSATAREFAEDAANWILKLKECLTQAEGCIKAAKALEAC